MTLGHNGGAVSHIISSSSSSGISITMQNKAQYCTGTTWGLGYTVFYVGRGYTVFLSSFCVSKDVLIEADLEFAFVRQHVVRPRAIASAGSRSPPTASDASCCWRESTSTKIIPATCVDTRVRICDDELTTSDDDEILHLDKFFRSPIAAELKRAPADSIVSHDHPHPPP